MSSQQKNDLTDFPPKTQGHQVLWPSKSSVWQQIFQGYPLGPFSLRKMMMKSSLRADAETAAFVDKDFV